MKTTKRCVLYARLSITKEESVSITRQLRSCRRYAESRGWEVIGEFVDDGVSAIANRPEDRKGWASLLATEGFDAVVIWKVDRLARRVLDFLHADEALQKRGAGLVAVEDPIDMTSPQGRAFAVMLAVFGEMEAESIRARVRAARAQLIRDRRFTGGGIPYGYTSAPNPAGPGRIRVRDPERIGWLTDIVRLALGGMRVNAIARWLNDRHAPLPRRLNAAESTRQHGWNRQTVDGLLRNPTLAGMTPYNPGRPKSAKRVDPFAVVRDEQGEPVIDHELAVITYDEFVKLQELLNSRDTGQFRKRDQRQATSALLSKVALCDACEVYLSRGTNQKRPVLYCPKCRQTLSRGAFDPYLIGRLLRERGDQPYKGSTVADYWRVAGTDEEAKREILVSQLQSLRVRRGVVGRYFDANRILLEWRSD